MFVPPVKMCQLQKCTEQTAVSVNSFRGQLHLSIPMLPPLHCADRDDIVKIKKKKKIQA